jgi:hypothetical protein
MMKKESRTAREVIRWLENQFKQGNRLVKTNPRLISLFNLFNQKFIFFIKRFIRAQNQNEKISNEYDASLRRRDAHMWQMHHLLDCCSFFQRQKSRGSDETGSATAPVKHLVTLLVSNKDMVIGKAVEKYKSFAELASEKSN